MEKGEIMTLLLENTIENDYFLSFTAEIEKEIERRVMEIVKIQSVEMENETGVQPSINDQEIHNYLKQVIREVKR